MNDSYHMDAPPTADSTLGKSRDNDLGLFPVIPVIDEVAFPGTTIGFVLQDEQRGISIQSALDKSSDVLIVPLMKDQELKDKLFGTVTLARVLQLKAKGKNTVVMVEGLKRVTLTELVGSAYGESGKAAPFTETAPPSSDEYWQAGVRNLRDAAIQLIQQTPSVPNDAEHILAAIKDPAHLTDFLAAHLDIEVTSKQKLLVLEEGRVLTRVDQLQHEITNQLNIASLQEKIREGVQTEFSDAQRHAFLREQLKAIKKELGEDESTDDKLAQLQERFDEAGLSLEVMESLQKELTRLERLPSASPDYASTLDYLETVAELPWSKLSSEHIDLDAAEAILNEDHHGLDRVKRRLLEYLAVRKLNPNGRGPILCLVGPPGVGKTSLGQSVARALGRDFVRVALGGVRDEAEIRGHRRTYVGAMMGRILQEIRRAGTRNPVIMLDEIDKMGADFRGDPASALLEVLDPAQNHTFVDHYVNLPFDLSQVVFVTTANVLDTIPAPLRDRMEIVQLSGYTPTEKTTIAQRYLIPRQLKENGVEEAQIHWQTDAVQHVIERYTREAGVRLLEQKLGGVIRSAATEIARQKSDAVDIDFESIADALGPPIYDGEPVSLQSKVGVVKGLAYTPVGGDVLPIEALRYAGSGHLQLTGQLGSVMQESAMAAESLVKARQDELGVDGDFASFDTHLHVPSGAIPKDGPSAGVAMFLALASLHTNRAVRGDVAMTGEVNLRGDVLPIGGLPEKTLAALANGIETVLIPKGNAKDIDTLPREVKDAVNLVTVSSIEEVIEYALLNVA